MEALRELGRDISTETKVQIRNVVTQDIPESLGVSHMSGKLQPNEKVSVSESHQNSESRYDGFAQHRINQMREEHQALLRRTESEVKEQIKSIQQEIRQLAGEAGALAQEIQIATMQATVNPGIYHKNFFLRLRSTIALLKKQIAESRHWLAEHNSRSKKRNYYWSQVKQSGTSFLLSSERYAVTSTG